MFRILALGDIVGEEAVEFLSAKLWQIRGENNIDFVVANGENAARGNGIDEKSARTILESGVDVITGGNHTFRHSSVYNMLDDNKFLVRPSNYIPECPGKGYTIIDLSGQKILVMNVSGVIFMDDALANPFETVDKILRREEGNYDISVLDIHAEATSEKAAIARYFDGKITVTFGTHTHVQTADERILPLGTAFITDLGMCGPADSILGVESTAVIEKLRTCMPKRFETAKGNIKLCGAIFEILDKKCISIKRFVY